MKKNLRNLALMIFLVSSSAYSGAWVQKKGEGLNILGMQRYISHQFWTPGSRLTNSPTYTKNYWSNYTEYGITDKFTLSFYLSGLESHTSATGTRGGMSDTLLAGRYLLWNNDTTVLSAQLFVDKLGNAAQFNIPPQNSPFNSGEAILIGKGGQFTSSTPQFWFADAAFGLVQRYSAGNQLQINLEAGFKFNDDRTWLMLQNFNTFSTDHINYPQGANYNLMTVAPSLLYWFNKTIGLQFGLTQDVFGQNVGKGRSVFIANWIRF